jgi:hypothetical protein
MGQSLHPGIKLTEIKKILRGAVPPAINFLPKPNGMGH